MTWYACQHLHPRKKVTTKIVIFVILNFLINLKTTPDVTYIWCYTPLISTYQHYDSAFQNLIYVLEPKSLDKSLKRASFIVNSSSAKEIAWREVTLCY